MNRSELITPMHQTRQAIIYVRQSTPHQVMSNRESLQLQYALKQQALAWGWQETAINTIDTDLGMTGTSIHYRAGFKEMVAAVTLGQIGLILSTDVTRLCRNCSDWYPLLDACSYQHCLIADQDGVYDPSTPNDRFLLGLKGQLSEMELHTIRARMTAGLLNKAHRGELALPLPVGLIRDKLDRVVKEPNVEVQHRLELVFSTFLRVKTASQVVRFFNEKSLLIPRHDRFKDVVWKKPTVAAILEILKNPAYAGAFVYGRSRTTRDALGKATQKRLPMAEWRICLQDKYPAYISWQLFEEIQAMLKDNYAEYNRNKSRGIPRPGAALLHGLVYCGCCGHKLLVQYKGGNQYLCNALRQSYQVPVCQRMPSDAIDAAVVAAFFAVISPMELDAYAQALAVQEKVNEEIDQAHRQQLARWQYESDLAQRQFCRVDPDNRLVAAELENRWETALQNLKQAQGEYVSWQQERQQPLHLSTKLREAFAAVGQNLPQIWQQDILTRPQKKALLRCLIDKVVVHRAPKDQVQTRIVWQGGETTTLVVPVTVGSFADLSGADEMQKIILELAHQGQPDTEIATHLTTLGYRSPMKTDLVLPSTVRGVRLKHGILQKRSQSHPRHISGYLTISQIARTLNLAPHWIYDRIKNGTIQIGKDPMTNLYLFPDNAATLAMFRQLKAAES